MPRAVRPNQAGKFREYRHDSSRGSTGHTRKRELARLIQAQRCAAAEWFRKVLLRSRDLPE